jgi:hypothetical protein
MADGTRMLLGADPTLDSFTYTRPRTVFPYPLSASLALLSLPPVRADVRDFPESHRSEPAAAIDLREHESRLSAVELTTVNWHLSAN